MFVVTFVVMLPIKLMINDLIQAWEAGLTWMFIQSFVLMAGGFIGPFLRRITPRGVARITGRHLHHRHLHKPG